MAAAATTQRGARKLSSPPKSEKPSRPRPKRTTAPPMMRSRRTLGFMPGRYTSVGEFAHQLVEVGLSLEADAGKLGHRHVAVFHAHAVGESAKGLEQVGIRFVAAQAQSRGDVERHLVPAVRYAARGRPAMLA